jgi:1,2-phenylacetyl-CoA epoxidase catalytic subunit
MIRYSHGADGKTFRETTHDDDVGFGDSDSVSGNHEYTPTKILGFYLDPRYVEMQAVVQCCAFKHLRSSPISTYWEQEFHTRSTKRWVTSIGVQSIVHQVLMMPKNDKEEGFHEIWGHERWADAFCDV